MKLLVPNREYTDFEGDAAELRQDIADTVADLGPYEMTETDIGPGADWPMFLITVSALGSAFLLGKQINESLDAWVEIGRKLRRAIERLRSKHGAVRVDEDGAKVLMIEHVAARLWTMDSIELVSLQTVPIHEFSARPAGQIDSRYDALYIAVLRVNDDYLFAVGMRSTGEIDFLHRYGAHFMTFGSDELR